MISIPMIVENDGDQKISCDIFSRLLIDRIIMLNGEISDDIVGVISAQILYLDAHDQEVPIYLYINSPGGSVSAGLAIYDTMKFVKAPITTLCMGTAASMGAFLLSAGTKGQRFSLPHAQIMVHQPSAGYAGQISDIEIHVRQFAFYKKTLNDILAEHTDKTACEIEQMCDRDRFLTPEEAKNVGIIDNIITSVDDLYSN